MQKISVKPESEIEGQTLQEESERATITALSLLQEGFLTGVSVIMVLGHHIGMQSKVFGYGLNFAIYG